MSVAPGSNQLSEQLAGWKRQWWSFDFMYDQALRRIQRFDDSRNIDDTTKGTMEVAAIRRSLERLHLFGFSLFHFLHAGISLGNPDYSFAKPELLKQHPEYGWLQACYPVYEYMMEMLIDRLSQDLLIMDQAVDQRFMGASTKDWEGLGIYRSIVAADRLASEGLKQASNLLGDAYEIKEKAKVLTYRRMQIHIRVIPYSELAMIGIPLTSLTENGAGIELLGIPHELGHYLYWNAVAKQSTQQYRTLRTALAGKLDAMRSEYDKLDASEKPLKQALDVDPDFPWLEEIFADVVGCLIGGPATALSMQWLMLPAVGQEFLLDNGHHPPPVLRPLIFVYVLEQIGHPAVAAELSQRWAEILKLRCVDLTEAQIVTHLSALPIQRVSSAATTGPLVPVAERIEMVKRYVDVILAFFPNLPQSFEPWTPDGHSVDEMIPAFVVNAGELISTPGESPPSNAPASDVTDEVIKRVAPLPAQDEIATEFNRIIGESFEVRPAWVGEVIEHLKTKIDVTLKTDSTVRTLAAPSKHTIPADDWLKVLDAGGWLTGPGGPRNYHGG